MQIISVCRQITPKLHITQFVSNSVSLYSYQHAVLCLTQLTQLSLTLCDPMDYSPPGPSAHRDSQPRILEWIAMLSSGDLPDPGIEPVSTVLQVDSLPSESPGKPMNTGVGSLSLLQGNFLTQELNWGLLHCRQILYQLSYQGSPFLSILCFKMVFDPVITP